MPFGLRIELLVTHSVLSVSSRALLAACRELGMDDARLVERARCDRRVIDDPDGRLAPEQVFALWDAAYSASGDQHLALRVARALPRGSYRVLEYLVESAPTLGAACLKICEYFAWIDTSARLVPVEADGLVGVGLEVDAPPEGMPLRAIEFTFATCFEKLRPVVSGRLSVARVDFAGAEGDAQPLSEFLGCPVVLQATGNRMLFEPEVWQKATTSGDATLHQLLDRHAQLSLGPLGERETTRIAQQILMDAGPTQTLTEVAKKMGLSVRTLQRRLSEEGEAFASLVDRVRANLARSLVSDPHIALVEAALLLGFGEQSSFTRSFKRWTGQTPSAYRARGVATGA